MICNAGLHGWCHSQCLMNPAEVVVHEVDGHGVGLVINLLAEPIGEPSHSSHAHPHSEILALHKTRGNLCYIGIAIHLDLSRTTAYRVGIPRGHTASG